jgi:hypothetical protein
VFTFTLSTISTNLLKEAKASWATDSTLLEIITHLEKDLSLHPHYTWVNGYMYRKGKLVVGNDSDLQGKLIFIYYDSTIGGPLWCYCHDQMVGIIILLEETTKAHESLCEGVSHLSEKQK